MADQIAGTIGDFLNPIIHSPIVQTSVRLAGLALVILWFVTALWAFRDAWSRTHNVVAVLAAPMVVMAATPVGFPLAVLVWRILRPQRTIAEAREQALTIDALRASTRVERCAACRSKVEPEWRRCPWCRTWLMAPCPRCERLVELSAAVCPWCITELAPGSLVPRVGMPSLVPVMAASAVLPVTDPSVVQPVAATAPVVDLADTSAGEAGRAWHVTPAPQVAAAAPDEATAVHPLWAPEPSVAAQATATEAPPRQPLWAPEPAVPIGSVMPTEPVMPIEPTVDAEPSASDALWAPEPASSIPADPAEPAHSAPRQPLWATWGAKASAWIERVSASKPSSPGVALWGPEGAAEPPVMPVGSAEATAGAADWPAAVPEGSAEAVAAASAKPAEASSTASAMPAEAAATASAQAERTTTVEPASLLGPNLPAAIPESALAPSAPRRARRPRGRATQQDAPRMPEEAASSSTALW